MVVERWYKDDSGECVHSILWGCYQQDNGRWAGSWEPWFQWGDYSTPEPWWIPLVPVSWAWWMPIVA